MRPIKGATDRRKGQVPIDFPDRRNSEGTLEKTSTITWGNKKITMPTIALLVFSVIVIGGWLVLSSEFTCNGFTHKPISCSKKAVQSQAVEKVEK